MFRGRVLVKYPVVGAPGFQVVVISLPPNSGSSCAYCQALTAQAISWGRNTPRGLCRVVFYKPVCPSCQEIAAGQMAQMVLGIVGLAGSITVPQGGPLMSEQHDSDLVKDELAGQPSTDASADSIDQAPNPPLTASEHFVRWLERNPFGCGM